MILSHSCDEFVLEIEEDEIYTHFYGFDKNETNSLKRIFIEEVSGLVDVAIENYKEELLQKEARKSNSEQNLTIYDLINVFYKAIENNHKYVGVKIKTEGSPEPEIIINHRNNFDKKLHYYKNAYNSDLTLKTCNDIKIIDLFSGYSASGVAEALTF